MNKIFIGLGAVILGGLVVWAYYTYTASIPNSSDLGSNAGGTVPAEGSQLPDAGPPVTLKGDLTCLPHKGDGPHTLECAYGLKGDDGKYYALQNLWEVAPSLTETGVRIQVVGNVSTPSQDEAYNIVGVVAVISTQKI